ncbi:basic salivary proline-rich protein 2-like [Dipodomys merriami]|uniref:basic salivary proline-rich protein 2-like n=1 Tax=Dipodomys merriami TaxID=94247 RepID=UPI003855FA51
MTIHGLKRTGSETSEYLEVGSGPRPANGRLAGPLAHPPPQRGERRGRGPRAPPGLQLQATPPGRGDARRARPAGGALGCSPGPAGPGPALTSSLPPPPCSRLRSLTFVFDLWRFIHSFVRSFVQETRILASGPGWPGTPRRRAGCALRGEDRAPRRRPWGGGARGGLHRVSAPARPSGERLAAGRCRGPGVGKARLGEESAGVWAPAAAVSPVPGEPDARAGPRSRVDPRAPPRDAAPRPRRRPAISAGVGVRAAARGRQGRRDAGPGRRGPSSRPRRSLPAETRCARVPAGRPARPPAAGRPAPPAQPAAEEPRAGSQRHAARAPPAQAHLLGAWPPARRAFDWRAIDKGAWPRPARPARPQWST